MLGTCIYRVTHGGFSILFEDSVAISCLLIILSELLKPGSTDIYDNQADLKALFRSMPKRNRYRKMGRLQDTGTNEPCQLKAEPKEFCKAEHQEKINGYSETCQHIEDVDDAANGCSKCETCVGGGKESLEEKAWQTQKGENMNIDDKPRLGDDVTDYKSNCTEKRSEESHLTPEPSVISLDRIMDNSSENAASNSKNEASSKAGNENESHKEASRSRNEAPHSENETESSATPRLDPLVASDNLSSSEDDEGDLYDHDIRAEAATAGSGTGYHPSNAQYPYYCNRINRSASMAGLRNSRGNLDEAVEAGLFYAGEGRELVCHYCGIKVPTLRGTDVAWIEHAKLNPRCGFVKFVKGDGFVRTIMEMYDLHGDLPTFASKAKIRARSVSMPQSPLTPSSVPLGASASPRPSTSGTSHAPHPSVSAVSSHSSARAHSFPQMAPRKSSAPTRPRVPRRQVQAREVRARLDLDTAKTLIKMGYSSDLVGAVIAEQMIYEGDDFRSFSDLARAVMAAAALGDEYPVQHYARGLAESASKRTEPKPKTGPAPTSMVTNSNSAMTLSIGATSWSDTTPPSGKGEDNTPPGGKVANKSLNEAAALSAIETQNRELKEKKMCKICFENDADTIFMPCGHLAVCQGCAQMLSECPLCRKAIAHSMKVKMS